jgi:hypothetical protein
MIPAILVSSYYALMLAGNLYTGTSLVDDVRLVGDVGIFGNLSDFPLHKSILLQH